MLLTARLLVKIQCDLSLNERNFIFSPQYVSKTIPYFFLFCFVFFPLYSSFGFSWVPCSTGAELNINHKVSSPHHLPPVTPDLVPEPRSPNIPHLCSTGTRAFFLELPSRLVWSSFRL